MILVTGATGQYGSKAIEYLITKGVSPQNIAALVRDKNKAETLKAKGVEIRVGDYNDVASLKQAFSGIDQLLFVSSSEVENRESQHKNVVEVLKDSTIKQVLYTSFVRNTPAENSAIQFLQDTHEKTEKWIKESGVNYTFLQNSLYADFVPVFLGDQVVEHGSIVQPAADGKLNAVLREELAEAAAVILTTEGHENKTYPLTNSNSYTYEEIAKELSEKVGKTITYQSPEADAFAKMLSDAGVPEEFIGMTVAFAQAQAQGELAVESSTLSDLLGREPKSIHAILGEVYA
tara:strand:- start:4576 stop:5445 length:870 start_codon:yes stop_codon:yes gene_type:complete